MNFKVLDTFPFLPYLLGSVAEIRIMDSAQTLGHVFECENMKKASTLDLN